MHQSIDWFSWLSKTGLEPSLIYEYGMAFSRNELEKEDIIYFNHELLQSMGISIAKHRLEILKLARKQKGPNGSHPISKLVIAITKTKRTLASYIWTWVHRDDSALVRKGNGSSWKVLQFVPVVYQCDQVKKGRGYGDHHASFDEDFGGGVEEIKWDTMFQNLKPT